MDKALAYGARDCGFKSHCVLFFSFQLVTFVFVEDTFAVVAGVNSFSSVYQVMDRSRTNVYSKGQGKSRNGLKSASMKPFSKRASAPGPSFRKAKQRTKIDIKQAINEALEDYTEEHIEEYSRYESELVPTSPMKESIYVDVEEPPKQEAKRRHSFDLQVTKSPVLLSRSDERKVEPLSLDSLDNLKREPSISPGPSSNSLFCDNCFSSHQICFISKAGT